MSIVAQRTPRPAEGDVAALIQLLTADLERTMAFAEECRWRAPELAEQAQALSDDAMRLFKETLRSLREEKKRHLAPAPAL